MYANLQSPKTSVRMYALVLFIIRIPTACSFFKVLQQWHENFVFPAEWNYYHVSVNYTVDVISICRNSQSCRQAYSQALQTAKVTPLLEFCYGPFVARNSSCAGVSCQHPGIGHRLVMGRWNLLERIFQSLNNVQWEQTSPGQTTSWGTIVEP